MDQIIWAGHHAEHDVPVREITGAINDFCPLFHQRFGLGTGTVINRYVTTGIKQQSGHGITHAAGTYPANSQGFNSRIRHQF